MLVEKNNLRKRIQKTQKGNEKVVKIVKKLKRTDMKILKDKEQTIKEEVVIKEGQIYMPEGELRREVIQLYYNIPMGEYRGR